MSVPASPTPVDERDLYPVHEEDDGPEISRHERQNGYLRPALRTHFPGAFVTGNVCIYWEPKNTRDYVAPDVFVVPGWRPEKEPRVYWLWEDPPIAFVVEVFSDSDTATIRQDKEAKYARRVQAPEYLSYDEERRELKLRRLGPHGYEEVAPLPNGRVRSEQLGLEFGTDEDGFLWIYTPAGERLLDHAELDRLAVEERERRQEAEARATEEFLRREAEMHRRQEAEALAAAEARQRQEAESRATAAESRAAQEVARRDELERELAALRARLQNGDP